MNNGQVYWCQHNWLERTIQVKEILKHSDSNSSNPIYFNKLRFWVCSKCGTIQQSIIKEEKGDLDNQVR